MKRLFSFVLFTAVAINANSQQNWDSIKVTSQLVRANIHMLKGSGGNIGVLTGEDGVVMIDDQFLELSTKIKDAIAALTGGQSASH